MSHPNDPYGHSGQQPWPGASGPQQPDPYQSDPYRQGPHQPNPYQTGPAPTQQFSQPDQYGQPGPYNQPGPYSQPGPYGAPGQPDQYGQYGQYGGPYGQYGQQQTPSGGWPQQDPTQQYPAYQYGGPPTPPPGTPYGAYGPLPQQPPRRRTGVVIGSMVAVIALVAAGIATYMFAFAGSAAGAPTPKEAAVNLVNALSRNDVVGLLDGLAPAEGAVAKDYLSESLEQLKRLQVVRPDAKPEQITGIAFTATDLVFDDAAEEKVSDHLSITKLVDGKVTISADMSKVPLTEKFLKKAFPDGVPQNRSQTFDVSDEIAKGNDGKPIRIATVKVDGEWYPSLFYSIADAALQDEGKKWPARSITANGADSPEAAVKQMLEATLRADVKRVIELTPPDEAAALHDVGQLLVDAAKDSEPSNVTLNELETRVDNVAGGKRVSLKKLVMENDGEKLTVEVNGDCVKVDTNGDKQDLCGNDLAKSVADMADLSNGKNMTDQQVQAIEHVAVGYLHSGLVTTKVDGKWYVSPVRSIGDISTGFLRAMQPGDIEALIDLTR